MADTSSMLTFTGKLKLLTIILGILAVGLHGDNYLRDDSKQEFYLSMLIIALILSFLLVIGMLLGAIPQTAILKKVDMAYHAIMAILLAISCIVMIVSMVDYADWASIFPLYKSSNRYKEWAAKASFAVIFGGINAIVYGVIAIFLFKE